MTDKEFQKVINKAQIKLHEYHKTLAIAENEYIRRFGFHPSDKDCDQWIDAMHVNGCGITVSEVKEEAEWKPLES